METNRLALPPGFRLESYEIIRALGKGGFGITYQARDVQIGRLVAIKELLPDSIATRVVGNTVVPQSEAHEENWQWARERFIEEARMLAGFRHPNIIPVHRIVEANGTVYLIMDCIEGESYEARLRRIGREPDQEALMRVIEPLLDGLQEVHASGLLHRDIKPENILLDKRGHPILIDFGAARSAVGATMTMTSIVTHGYSPAEQYQTKGKLGSWTDIYAVAAVMCRAISGEKPPVASDRIMDDDFIWLSNRGLAGFEEKFLAAVDWALRVRPEERPQHIADWESHLIVSPVSSLAVESPTREEILLPTADLPSENTPAKKRTTLSFHFLGVLILSSALIGSFFVTKFLGQWHEWKSARDLKVSEHTRMAQQEANVRTSAAQEAGAAPITLTEALKAEEWKKAAKESPYVNSLGMKFVPVPGTDVLFSIWDTRVKDYAVFSKETGAFLVQPDFPQTPNDPVVNVSWDEAQAFCKWLTAMEQAAGIIGKNNAYRLPTDAEWSAAVGLSLESGNTPKERDKKVDGVFPWGTQWPPSKGVGNYDPSLGVDSFVNTSPVGSFVANQYGLYDTGGNVSQWCEDLYSTGSSARVVRGASWAIYRPEYLLSSFRDCGGPGIRNSARGFRCVFTTQK